MYSLNKKIDSISCIDEFKLNDLTFSQLKDCISVIENRIKEVGQVNMEYKSYYLNLEYEGYEKTFDATFEISKELYDKLECVKTLEEWETAEISLFSNPITPEIRNYNSEYYLLKDVIRWFECKSSDILIHQTKETDCLDYKIENIEDIVDKLMIDYKESLPKNLKIITKEDNIKVYTDLSNWVRPDIDFSDGDDLYEPHYFNHIKEDGSHYLFIYLGDKKVKYDDIELHYKLNEKTNKYNYCLYLFDNAPHYLNYELQLEKEPELICICPGYDENLSSIEFLFDYTITPEQVKLYKSPDLVDDKLIPFESDELEESYINLLEYKYNIYPKNYLIVKL